MHDLPPDQVDPELRRRIKAMSYGLAYGLSDFGLAAQLGIPRDEAREQMDAYFARFGGVREYLRSVVAEARLNGYTETILGRRRYLPDLTSDNGQRRAMAERMALNAPIQGSAADIIKIAMLGVHHALRDAGLRSRLLLQVHDELVLEVSPGEREQVEEIVRREMAGAYTMDVPLDVSVGYRPHLGRGGPLIRSVVLDEVDRRSSCAWRGFARRCRSLRGRVERRFEARRITRDVTARPTDQDVGHEQSCREPRDRRHPVERLHPLAGFGQLVSCLHLEDVGGADGEREDRAGA